MTVCCNYRIICQLVDRPKDENDSETDGFQNVHICGSSRVLVYAERHGYCTDNTSIAYSVVKGIKAGESGEEIVPKYQIS